MASVSTNERPADGGPTDGETTLRPHAEQEHQAELAALAAGDDRPRPPGWRLSPWAVTTYLLGGTAGDGAQVTAKYVGPRRLVEVAVATLATDRALLLLGVPGTAKTWLSEHLAAAICGDSTLMVQGTAGTAEEAVRYGWNYAPGSSPRSRPQAAMVPGPVLRAHGQRPDRAGRGADPDALGRAGRPRSPSCPRRPSDSRSWPANCRRSGGSTSSPPPTTGTAA